MILCGGFLFFVSQHRLPSFHFPGMYHLLSCCFLFSSRFCPFSGSGRRRVDLGRVRGLGSLAAGFSEGGVLFCPELWREREGRWLLHAWTFLLGFLYVLSRLHGGWYGARMGGRIRDTTMCWVLGEKVRLAHGATYGWNSRCKRRMGIWNAAQDWAPGLLDWISR